MKSCLVNKVVIIILTFFISGPCSVLSDGEDETNHEISNHNDDRMIQENPEYVPPPSDRSEDGEEILKGEDSKSAVEKALKPSRKSLLRRSVNIIKKHRVQITIALALFAFRRELGQFVFHVLSKPTQDPVTGEVTRHLVPFSPTAIIKVLLFVALIRKLQISGGLERSSPLAELFLMRANGNPLLALFLARLLAPHNSAYIVPVEQHYSFERINERYKKDGMALRKAIDPHTGGLGLPTGLTPRSSLSNFLPSQEATMTNAYNSTIVIMDLCNLDTGVSQIGVLRDEVSFLMSEYQSGILSTTSDNNVIALDFEVVVLLESPGGSAADYALAAQQLLRLRNAGINMTICVDKVAASGGYMMACTASPGRLFAAPFAVLGSIGVYGQSLNIHKTLEGWGVKPLVFRGGRDKAPVGLIGEVTEEGLAKVQAMVDRTHQAFKRHVVESRPMIQSRIEDLSTGDVWLGYDALDVGLVDRIITSDEYIGERIKDGARVLKLVQLIKPKYPFARPTTVTSTYIPESPLRSLSGWLGQAWSYLDSLMTGAHWTLRPFQLPGLGAGTSHGLSSQSP